MSALLAAAPFGANLIFALFLLVATVGIVFGFFTVTGSGINNHPSDGRGAAPGSRLPDEFHQFADRQIHDADLREAEIERRVDARLAQTPVASPRAPFPRRHVEGQVSVAQPPSDDISLDEANRRLAAEAEARKSAGAEQRQEH